VMEGCTLTGRDACISAHRDIGFVRNDAIH
jgi:hypothetical protein